MNRYGTHGERHMEFVWRALRISEIFGAKYMVVHGDEFDFAHMEYTFSENIPCGSCFFVGYVI